jgi:antitoxin component of MazEF toxin-antitoxin module
MVKTITKIGNSAGLILDQAILELVHLKVGDEVDISVDSTSGVMRIASLRPMVSPEDGRAMAREFIQQNDELFRRLA